MNIRVNMMRKKKVRKQFFIDLDRFLFYKQA
jgi:hypothetical protein